MSSLKATLKKPVNAVVNKVLEKITGDSLSQESFSALGKEQLSFGMEAMARRLAAESCVLLKNNDVLPLTKNEEIAVFGRCQKDWFYVGYGSGGDVNPVYCMNLCEALRLENVPVNRKVMETYDAWTEKNKADPGSWGTWPMSHPEMPLKDGLVSEASKTSKKAVVVIGRAAGEDRENLPEKGSFYLTKEEHEMIKKVIHYFRKVIVVMNIGNIMDFQWMEEYGDRIGAVLIAWQGGMESGRGLCDVLYGKSNANGRLPDTIARYYGDYPSSDHFGGKEYNDYAEDIFIGYRHFEKNAPEQVLFPFGYGLSYTIFETKIVSAYKNGDLINIKAAVSNIGKYEGRETIRLYVRQTGEGLVKAYRVLLDFHKTGNLKPGESEVFSFVFHPDIAASFDEDKSAFLLEKGSYVFMVESEDAFTYSTEQVIITEKVTRACVPEVDLKKRISGNLPEEIEYTGNRDISFPDVQKDETKLCAFIAQLSNEELEALTRGHGMMNSTYGTPGNAGAFGGIIKTLEERGVPAVVCSDGPAGIRLKRRTGLYPCGTALASTWDPELIREAYAIIGKEMERLGVDVFLGPGMNIHRNPLCGRNFEYFSEDPLLSGKMAAAVVKGIQSVPGRFACPKHFACNNQEKNRSHNDSRVSERALREIYLKNFEICIKDASPSVIMTSYNKINGVWAHYNYDLATTVLRKDWGFDGVVITDWWMRKSYSPEFRNIRDNAYRIRAGVDVLMPGNMSRLGKAYKSDGTLLESLGQEEGITRGELTAAAERVLRLTLKTMNNKHYIDNGCGV